jgi:hypothetical protein
MEQPQRKQERYEKQTPRTVDTAGAVDLLLCDEMPRMQDKSGAVYGCRGDV